MPRIPTCSADIDPAWLNEVLPDDVRGGARVTAVRAEVIGEGVGFIGELARLTIDYDQPGVAAVRTMISKLPTSNEGFRHIGVMMGLYRKEHGFYAEVAPTTCLSVPATYHNGADLTRDEYVLLMEDMAPLRAGNQLEGCTPAEAALALRELARFHAAWWESPRLHDVAAWLPGPHDPYFDILEGAMQQGLPKLSAHFSHLVTQSVLDLAQRTVASFAESRDRGMARRPHTFVHGDFRLDNMMFGDGTNGPDFTLLDWQLPFRANPMCDIVYFLAGNFEPAWRREHETALLATYHEALVDAGVLDYSMEQCIDDYRACGLILIGYLVTIAGDMELDTLNDRGREVVEMMFRRYATCIDDLESAAYLV